MAWAVRKDHVMVHRSSRMRECSSADRSDFPLYTYDNLRSHSVEQLTGRDIIANRLSFGANFSSFRDEYLHQIILRVSGGKL